MILCAGDSLIDLIPHGGLLRPVPGGAIWNTALALGRLGARAGYLWPISRDGFGAALLRPLVQAGVDVRLCPRSDRPTTLAVVTLAGGEARYGFYDEGTASRDMRAETLPLLPPDVEALVIGGISLMADPGATAMETLARRAAGAGLPVILDPNIRPALIEGPGGDPVQTRARLDRLTRLARVVSLSAADLAWLAPGTDPEDAASTLLAAGPALVVLREGAAGATALWRDAAGAVHRRAVSAPAVTVVDTIGAGDVFNAGLIESLWRAGALTDPARLSDDTLAAALRQAVRAAAFSVTRPGADPPWRPDLDTDPA